MQTAIIRPECVLGDLVPKDPLREGILPDREDTDARIQRLYLQGGVVTTAQFVGPSSLSRSVSSFSTLTPGGDNPNEFDPDPKKSPIAGGGLALD